MVDQDREDESERDRRESIAEDEHGDREDDSEWKFSVDEVGRGRAQSETESVIERLRSADPEPGSPSLENSVFVVLGATLTLAVFLLLAGVI